MTDDLVAFVRARLAEGVEQARWSGNMLVTQGAPAMNVPLDVAEKRARLLLHAAEARQALLERTVMPYLGTAGLPGRVAAEQLRLLGWEFLGHPDYRDQWRPDPV
ncbi:hypothetical protein GLX30_30375 [Streptomyces sp. Tu 2975]|uniref:DUF6221 family protein n=1 Tax=Streptomyces sp. Tu 2975 TaxID=2676871 RepID=UPI0013568AB5|nr:DUF6221 family protein [Streptomyces sp. Tu 2975]QIP87621.1 hypothetical protein GLX30_30375 [Streptomyces sp. Tu 2975]